MRWWFQFVHEISESLLTSLSGGKIEIWEEQQQKKVSSHSAETDTSSSPPTRVRRELRHKRSKNLNNKTKNEISQLILRLLNKIHNDLRSPEKKDGKNPLIFSPSYSDPRSKPSSSSKNGRIGHNEKENPSFEQHFFFFSPNSNGNIWLAICDFFFPPRTPANPSRQVSQPIIISHTLCDVYLILFNVINCFLSCRISSSASSSSSSQR